VARASRTSDVEIEGLNELLRDLRALPKEASAELRLASQRIATQHMVPAWKSAASNAGPWGDKLQATIKAKRDRLPSIVIGAQRPRYGRGATPNMVRYPSDKGLSRSSDSSAAATFAEGRNWMRFARSYVPGAIQEWGRAIEDICDRFNSDRRGIG
jgi:hypothetical protein